MYPSEHLRKPLHCLVLLRHIYRTQRKSRATYMPDFPRFIKRLYSSLSKTQMDSRMLFRSYKPTSTHDATQNLREIFRAKSDDREVDIPMTQIAFSRLGLNALGVNEPTGDPRFDRGPMLQDKYILGDRSDWDPLFNDANTHGLITVCAKGKETFGKAKDDIIRLFQPSIRDLKPSDIVEGNVRPGENKGKEHFGYLDSLSQPSLRDLTHAFPGQHEVDPGVIVMGYKGDPIFDNPELPQRPAWTRNGSMMVFRKLEQDVPEFDQYLKENGKDWRNFAKAPDEAQPPLSDEEGAELFGAYMVGRWKSGTPLALAHFRDTVPPIGGNTKKTNDFDYVKDLPRSIAGPSDRYCPFTAHTRKTAPRNLDPFIHRKYMESAIIARAGIPYGSECTEATKDEKRGLLFVCYQSSIDNGFYLQTTGFANNDFFPVTNLVPQKHGQDPILGGPEPVSKVTGAGNIEKDGQIQLVIQESNSWNQYRISGWAEKIDPGLVKPEQKFFVTSRGGEYLFVPSVSTLQTWANTRNPGLDIMFLQDATGSLQAHVDQARDSIEDICDMLIKSGKWSKDDLRVGLIAFRDHPPQDKTFVTQSHELTTDVSSIIEALSNIKAEGGGDGPEAQSDALADALTANWRDDATKVVVLITDSPPHGIGEDQDKLPDGCPEQNDPLRIANRMAKLGITLYVVACEPSLSTTFAMAHDFYAGITQKTGGKLLGLTDVTALGQFIVGLASESLETNALVSVYEPEIRKMASDKSFGDICEHYTAKMKDADVHIHALAVEDAYQASDIGTRNQQIWLNADKLDRNVLGQIQDVHALRLKPNYRSKTGTKQAPAVRKSAINNDQVQRVIRQCLARTQA
ncbi:hypothetical protein BJ138DRAFT_390834 [Hygrophoropsis aurantiaca]|uniref:Uncharacterized protein n=1 Tax=Hygrophoropsis aurantiaca TaxID=72124 RepID=A0ACB8A537_9AGAM|nr:hypothetical protein BJ138DRAFT_390834 [Hygrophoropsis aurantiaca]